MGAMGLIDLGKYKYLTRGYWRIGPQFIVGLRLQNALKGPQSVGIRRVGSSSEAREYMLRALQLKGVE